MDQAVHTSDEIDYVKLQQQLEQTSNDSDLFETIVNAPMDNFKVATTFLFLGIIVFLLVDKEAGTIDRVALSKTPLAQATRDVSVKKFEEIKIPLNHSENIISKAISTGKPQKATDWKYLFTPDLTPQQARINQASAGIALSAVYPLIGARDGGALIFSYFQYPDMIGKDQEKFMEIYSQLVTESLIQAQDS
jgi:hypothetical protein